MTKDADIDFTEDRLFSLGFGLIFKAVCAPSSWPAEKVAAQATQTDPPGTSANRWVISEPDPERDEPFKNTNHCQCPDDEHRTHWLLNC